MDLFSINPRSNKLIYNLINGVIHDIEIVEGNSILHFVKSIETKQRNETTQHVIVLMYKSHNEIVETTNIEIKVYGIRFFSVLHNLLK